jgi:hypothetical protein
MNYIGELFDSTLRLPKDTLLRVFAGDDWSFVIRVHAIVESLISHLLASSLDQRLAPVFHKLSLGGGAYGKLSFAAALGLVTADERHFIGLLSSLRNNFAHDPKYLGYTLQQHFDELDNTKQNEFLKALTGVVPLQSRDKWLTLAREDVAEAFRKQVYVFLLGLFTLAYKAELSQVSVKVDDELSHLMDGPADESPT